MKKDFPIDIFEIICSSLTSIKDIEFELTPDVALKNLQLDSLDYIFVQLELHKIYGIELEDNSFGEAHGKIKTLGEFAIHVDTLRQLSGDNSSSGI